MITVTITGGLSGLQKKLKELRNPDKIFREAALNSLALVSTRIQQKGLDSEGQLIGGGKYSSGKKKIGGFKDVANKRQQKNQTTDVFGGGYEEFRRKAGRQTNYIDLTLTGAMFAGFTVERINNDYVVGFTGSGDNSPSWKARMNEERFGELFSLTRMEEKLIFGIIEKNVNEILK
jgi:hypothetical protein